MAAELALTGNEFDEKVLKSDLPVLIDFWAPWCGPCRAIAPSLEQIATEYEGKAKVYKIDVDVDGDLASKYGVMSIPALFVFKGGQVVEKAIGQLPKKEIAGLIDRALVGLADRAV